MNTRRILQLKDIFTVLNFVLGGILGMMVVGMISGYMLQEEASPPGTAKALLALKEKLLPDFDRTYHIMWKLPIDAKKSHATPVATTVAAPSQETPKPFPLAQEICLVICFVDPNPDESYCVLGDLRTGQQILLRVRDKMERIPVQVVGIGDNKVILLYQDKMWVLEKEKPKIQAKWALDPEEDKKAAKRLALLEEAIASARFVATPQGLRVEEPGLLAEMGILKSDIIVTLNNKPIFSIKELKEELQKGNVLAVWTIQIKRNKEDIVISIFKK
jgi:hypothetical protein